MNDRSHKRIQYQHAALASELNRAILARHGNGTEPDCWSQLKKASQVIFLEIAVDLSCLVGRRLSRIRWCAILVPSDILIGGEVRYGIYVSELPPHIRDMNATILHQMGIDHNRLTFKYQSLEQRLTGVEPSRVVEEILG